MTKRFKIKLSDIGKLIDCDTQSILAVSSIANELIPLCDLLNEQHETIAYLKEVSDNKDNEIFELGKQRNYLTNENKILKLKIKMLEQVKPIKELPKSIDMVIRND